jgi:hypothetical protein
MAKIKTRNSDNHHTKPRGVKSHSFQKVYWPYIPIVLIIGVLLSIGAQSGSLAAYAKHPGGRVLAYATSMTISGLLNDTNTARASTGVPVLKLNSKLDAAAQANADDMAARDYWSHYTPEGNPPWIWVNNQGYAYQALAQNLATGFSDEQSTIDGWMASPPHRENLLNSTYTEVGFGYANSPNYTSAGGGPMTIVVAFYGQPQVLAASTTGPTPTASGPSQPATAASAPVSSAPQQTPAAATADQSAVPAADTATQQADNKPSATRAATTSTPKSDLAPPIKASRMQLTLGRSTLTGALTAASIAAAVGIALIWARKHLRAIHKFLIKGERYVIRHPLTDIGMLIIAGLLFILSQTAGLIQ